MFPGYVFCCLDLLGGPKLYRVPGVIGFVGFGGQPIVITAGEIAAVRAIDEAALAIRSVPYYECGERVILTSGPLANVSGVFVRYAKEGRADQVVVSLPLLRRAVSVTVPSCWLECDRPLEPKASVACQISPIHEELLAS